MAARTTVLYVSLARRLAAGLVIGSAFFGLVACSGSSHSKPAAVSAPTPVDLKTSVRAQVQQRLKLAPLFAGATPSAAAVYQTDAEAIAANPDNEDYQATIRQFSEEGMQEFGSQHLKIAATADAIVTVLAFGSTDDAARAVEALTDTDGQSTDFNVPAVPGAIGDDFLDATGEVSGRNIYFHSGAYAYIVGFAPTSPPSASQPSQQSMAAAAASWYRSVMTLG
jgi:hypothetical protein